MAFRLDTYHREVPDTADLTEIAVSGFDYALRYTTNHYDDHPLDEESISINIERKNTQDEVEVLFEEKMYDNIVEKIDSQLEADKKARKDKRR